MIKLFEIVLIHNRVVICLDYYKQYVEALTVEWKNLDRKTTVPATLLQNKKYMQNVYNFLK